MQNNTFSTLFIGQNLIKLIEVDSTNTYTKQLLSKSEPLAEGTVIMADHQTAGRGQQGARWEGERGKNLMVSVYLKPKLLPIDKHFFLTMAVALAVKDALLVFVSAGIKIKWPNDIFWNDKKIGGILIENTLTGAQIKSSIIGIGLNINQSNFGNSIVFNPVSTMTILGKELDLNDVLASICKFLEKYYLMVIAGKYEILHKYYLESLYLKNEWAVFNENGQVFEGSIIDVNESGLLMIDTKIGIRGFNFKEVQFLHKHTK